MPGTFFTDYLEQKEAANFMMHGDNMVIKSITTFSALYNFHSNPPDNKFSLL